jgi:hypothetical protein
MLRLKPASYNWSITHLLKESDTDLELIRKSDPQVVVQHLCRGAAYDYPCILHAVHQ